MRCAEVRERLSDHLLAQLPEDEDLRVRRHLRGCGPCRSELRALEEGLAVFTATVPAVEPEGAVRDRVLGALEEEWRESQEGRPRRPVAAWVTATAAVLALVAAVTWGGLQARRAERAEREAASYEHVLGILGGTGFRVGEIRPVAASGVRGSVLVYRSVWGRSWAAVFLRVPGGEGELRAALTGPGVSLAFGSLRVEDGEAWGWLTTEVEVDGLDRVWVRAEDGTLLASGEITPA